MTPRALTRKQQTAAATRRAARSILAADAGAAVACRPHSQWKCSLRQHALYAISSECLTVVDSHSISSYMMLELKYTSIPDVVNIAEQR